MPWLSLNRYWHCAARECTLCPLEVHGHGLISTWAFEVLTEGGGEAGESSLGEEKWRAGWSLFSFAAGTKSIVDRERTS